MRDKPVVGVDVSKEWLDLCCQGTSERIANTQSAIAAWLDRVRPVLVAVEPTGGYERRCWPPCASVVSLRCGCLPTAWPPFAAAAPLPPRPTASTPA
jgi:hypothetical protein